MARKRGFASITQQRSGRFTVRYTARNGARVSAGRTFARKADAEAWAADKRREIDAVSYYARPRYVPSVIPANLVATSIAEAFDPTGYFVYLIWGDDPETPLYVGKSTNILARLGAHMTSDKRPVTRQIQLFRCDDSDVMEITEARLIRHFRPPLNKRDVDVTHNDLDRRVDHGAA